MTEKRKNAVSKNYMMQNYDSELEKGKNRV